MRPEDFQQGIAARYTGDGSDWILLEINDAIIVGKSLETGEVRLFRATELTLEGLVSTDGLFAAMWKAQGSQ